MPDAYLPPEAALLIVRRDGEAETMRFEPANQYTEMVDHFGAAVLGGRPLAAPAEDGEANMRVLERLLAAASQHS